MKLPYENHFIPKDELAIQERSQQVLDAEGQMKKSIFRYLNKVLFFLAIGVMLFMSSCDVLQQVSQMANLTRCQFRLTEVQQLTLSGINIQNIKKTSDLNIMDYGKLINAVATNNFPLDFVLNLEAKNPNPSPAGMNKLEWILFIDDIEMTRGNLNRQISIQGNNGVSVIPLNMHFDLKKVLANKSADAIVNFAMNLAGAGNQPTRFMLKVKPTINVGGVDLAYPDFINVKTSFVNN